jgi:hypothetical protein
MCAWLPPRAAACARAGWHAALLRAGRHMAAWPATRYPVRAAAMGALGATALALVVFQYQFRHLEAVETARVLGVRTPALAASSAPIVWFGLGRAGAFALEITPYCSSALLIVPLCGLGILLLIPRKLPVGRVVRALAAREPCWWSGTCCGSGSSPPPPEWVAAGPGTRSATSCSSPF